MTTSSRAPEPVKATFDGDGVLSGRELNCDDIVELRCDEQFEIVNGVHPTGGEAISTPLLAPRPEKRTGGGDCVGTEKFSPRNSFRNTLQPFSSVAERG